MAGRVAFGVVRACEARRELPRRASAIIALLLLLATLLPVACASAAAAQPVKGSASAGVENGFARLVLFLGGDVASQVRVANNVIVISFDRPVDLSVDHLVASIGDYIGAARRDPDGKAVRLALARKVTVSSMAAGERLFVDLLPDTWSGLPPGLPREVIEELARRARDAEKKVRQDRPADRDRKIALIRVRIAKQPTFIRYTFELPEPLGVAADNRKDKLILTFSAMLKFDLADAKASLPPSIQSIDSELDQDTAVVRFTFGGKVDVRTFREDNSYVVDIGSAEPRSSRAPEPRPSDELAALAADLMAKKATPGDLEPPQTVPAKPAAGAPEAKRPPAPAAAAPAEASRQNAAPAPAASAPAPEKSPPAAPTSVRDPPPPAPSGPATVRAAAPSPPPAPNSSAAQPVPEPAAEAETAPADPNATVEARLKSEGDNLSLRFPFADPTPAAVFRRADMLWLVFDSDADIKLAGLRNDPSHNIKSATVTRQRGVSIVRIKLERPRLASVATEGATWVVNIGSQVIEPTRPLGITRNGAGQSRPTVAIMIDDPREVHQLEDPEAGDSLLLVTALAPARGFVNGQDFVEFRLLASAQGIVVQPLADDLHAELAPDRVVLTRPTGLTLSFSGFSPERSAVDDRPNILDPQLWTFDRKDDFGKRESQLMFAAAKSPESQRLLARIDLARFYLAWEMSAEAKGVLDVVLKDSPPSAANPIPLVLRALADLMLDRPQDALKDLANPVVGNQYEARLWRALAYSALGRWAEAHDGFHDIDPLMASLPIQLQRRMMRDVIRAAIEVGDVTAAVDEMRAFEVIGIPRELEPTMAVLGGRVAELLGRIGEALQSYRSAADSWDRRASAQGQLREINLQQSLGKLQRTDAIGNLETLTTIWRGDEIEIEALKLLAHLYTEEGRYRDSFHVTRTALTAHPNSTLTRAIQDEAAQTFESLFLAGRGDALSAIDGLALFYDFRDLTPIGRRGDEMIRRLADRLVTVDLLDQAAELLQYQVDNRLEGAARAQVATRLAVIYLMNRKADRAFATLRATRVEDLSNEMRQQRLLIEARALSELGRHDVALEIITNIGGREPIKLRADILWSAHRWHEAAEQIELLYGDRWKEFAPLNELEQADILRAAAGYALGEDWLGLARFRERYAGKMGEGPNRRAFEVISAPLEAGGTDFRAAAHAVAAVDSLDGFLRDLRRRFPDSGLLPPKTAPRALTPATTGTTAPRPPFGRTAAR